MLLIPQEPGVYVPQGNHLLFELLGAEVRIIDGELDHAGLLAAQEAVQDELLFAGCQPVVLDRCLDYGVDATIAYVDAGEELSKQLGRKGILAEYVYLTAGAGMTVAGIALGFKHLGCHVPVTGVCVARPAVELRADICQYAQQVAWS